MIKAKVKTDGNKTFRLAEAITLAEALSCGVTYFGDVVAVYSPPGNSAQLYAPSMQTTPQIPSTTQYCNEVDQKNSCEDSLL